MFNVLMATLATAATLQAAPQKPYSIEWSTLSECNECYHAMNEGLIKISIVPKKGVRVRSKSHTSLKIKRNKNIFLESHYFSSKKGDFEQDAGNAAIHFVVFEWKLNGEKDQLLRAMLTFTLCNKSKCKTYRNIKLNVWLEIDGC